MNIEPIMLTLLSYVTTWWTPVFFVLFVAVLAYAFWPRNRDRFEAAAKMPMLED